jgi:hypothetical protein
VTVPAESVESASPSPNDHFHLEIAPLDESVNRTSRGTSPRESETVKYALTFWYTISVATELVHAPHAPRTMQRKSDAWSDAFVTMVQKVSIAPLTVSHAIPPPTFLIHWYDRGGVPVALMLKLAVCPSITLRFTGCRTIDGGAHTVRLAALLFALLHVLNALHRYLEPSSPAATVNVY